MAGSFAARRERWPADLGVAEAKAKHAPDYYQTLLTTTLREETIVQIEKDLPRTMDHELLKQGSPMRDSLKRVLMAIAAHDAVLGYVQSMNFIAAYLLLTGMEEEDAFWCLTVIIYRVIPGYFSDGMARIFLDGRVLGALLHLHLPAVGLQLQELSAATTGDDAFALRIITQQWLQTLFVNVMPEECTLAVWDLLLSSRDRSALFCAALALLEPAQERIAVALEMGVAVELMQGLGAELRDAPDAAAAFCARMARFAQTLVTPAALRVAVARELGENGAVAGLERAEDVAPVTDTGELLRGVRSGEDLREMVLGAAAAGGAHAGDGLVEQEAALHAIANDSKDGAAAILGPEELARLTTALRAVSTQMAGVPALRNTIRSTVNIIVNFPLGLLSGRTSLPRAVADFDRQYATWDAAVAALLAAPRLAWADAPGARGSLWEQWVGGPYEAQLRTAEALQAALARAVDAWKTTVIELQTPEETSASSMAPKKERMRLAGADAEAAVEAAVRAHAARIREDLSALRGALAAKTDAARGDLPTLRANEAALADWLRARAAAAAAGAGVHATAMERRRAGAATALAAELARGQAAAGAALQAAAAAPLPDGQALGYGAERAHLDAYIAALEDTRKAVASRQKRIAREEAALASLRKRADSRAAADAARLEAARGAQPLRPHSRHGGGASAVRRGARAGAAAACVAHLEALAAAETPARCDALVAAMDALCEAVGEVWRAKLVGYAGALEAAGVGLGMNALTLANRAEEELGELSARLGVELRAAAEKEANRVNVRKELAGFAKGLGNALQQQAGGADGATGAAAARGGGLFSGLGFGRRGAGSAEPVAPSTPASSAMSVPDLMSMEDGGSPPDGSRGKGDAPAAAAAPPEEAGEPRKKSRHELQLEQQLAQVAERKAALSEQTTRMSQRTMDLATEQGGGGGGAAVV